MGGVEGPAGAIGVEGDGHAAGPEHVRERVHDGRQRLAEPELRVEQALGGVIEDRDEGLARVRIEREPGVGAAVEMQQFAEAGPGLAPPSVAAPGAALGHEPRLLEGEPDAVGEPHAVIAAGEVMEVPHVEAAVGVAVQAQHALDLGHRRFAGRGQLASVIEADHLVGFIPGPSAAQAPRMDTEDVGRLQPAKY